MLIKFVKCYNDEAREGTPYDKYFARDGLMSKLAGSHSMHLPPTIHFASSLGAECQKSKKSDGQVKAVLAFLDHHFASGDIDHPGDDASVRYTKVPWCTLYENYMESCKSLSLPPVRYDKFVSIR